MDPESYRLMVKAAKLYYENGFKQEAISDRLRISRPRVSRLLTQARETGVVQFTIATMPGIYADLEREIEARFNLDEVMVVEVSDPNSHMIVARELGKAAAEHFRRTVQNGDVIGITWGETLASMVDNLPVEKKQDVIVAQMVGGLGDPAKDIHATDIVRRIAQKLDATMSLIPAPGIVDACEVAKILRAERYIEQAIQTARTANITFAGLGALNAQATYMRDESIITWEQVKPLIARGAVGEIGLHFFDISGKPIQSEIDECIIGVELGAFRSLPRVVGAAGGSEKLQVILGAVRGGYLKTLITDLGCARYLLEQA